MNNLSVVGTVKNGVVKVMAVENGKVVGYQRPLRKQRVKEVAHVYPMSVKKEQKKEEDLMLFVRMVNKAKKEQQETARKKRLFKRI